MVHTLINVLRAGFEATTGETVDALRAIPNRKPVLARILCEELVKAHADVCYMARQRAYEMEAKAREESRKARKAFAIASAAADKGKPELEVTFECGPAVFVHLVKVSRETEKAVCLRCAETGRTVWVPKAWWKGGKPTRSAGAKIRAAGFRASEVY